MARKRIGILILVVAFIFAFTGCQALQDFAAQASGTATAANPDTSEPLPTLPVDHSADLISTSVLMDYVNYTAPQISKDGSMILYRHMTDTEDDVVAENWQTGEQTKVSWPNAAGNPNFYWAPDGETVLFFIDNYGDENFGLYTSDIRTGETKTILPGGENNCYYVADNPNNDKEIYLQILNAATKRYDLYRMNYDTGESSLVLENPGTITGYIFDHSGNLRIVTTTDEQAGKHVWLKTDAADTSTVFSESGWRQIFSWDYEDADTSYVMGFMQDDTRILYVDSSANNTSTLYTYNPATDETVEIFNDPDYDLYGSWTDLALDEVTAVTVYSQYIEWHVLDESFEDDYEALSAIGDVFDIIGSSDEDAYWIVEYISDTQQPDYYVYDMATDQAKLLYNAQPDLEAYQLAHKEPFAYTSGDGLAIEGYVTFPVDSDKMDLPTVVLVHGGPWVRDTWGYDSEVQFLANRGYAVIQVNYRGSSGYGKSFMRAGDKEWGDLMHQDILDAVYYAIGQGWTDADHVGVYGASYGGYESLICAAFSSDVFQCAVDAFGPSDLETFIESIPSQWSVEYQDLVRSVGDPATEAQDMAAHSPLNYAGDVKIPVLIAQGENDVRVPQQQSDQMVEALKDAGVDVTYMLFPDTGHGFNTLSARLDFYSSMEDFFAEHLGGRTINAE